MAFHVGPRLIIAAVYRAYHLNLINPNAKYKVGNKSHAYTKAFFFIKVVLLHLSLISGNVFIFKLYLYYFVGAITSETLAKHQFLAKYYRSWFLMWRDVHFQSGKLS